MILRAIHKNDLADGNNFSFLQQPRSGPFVTKQLSDIAAAVADYHIDIAKTVGIKRVRVKITFDYFVAANQVLIFSVMDGFGPFDNVILHGNVWSDPFVIGKTGSFFINTPIAWYRPGGYDTAEGTQTSFPISPYNSTDPMSDSGITGDPPTTPSPNIAPTTHHPIDRTFLKDEFQLVNLNFKEQLKLGVTPDYKIYDYTYASETDRLAANGFVAADVGKLARQTATPPIAGDTTWEILSIKPDTTAVWAIRTSSDDKAQIDGGCMFSRPVLIFTTGSDGTYSEDIFQLFPSYTSPDQDWWNDRITYPSIPAHDAKDERLEWIDYPALAINGLTPYDVYAGGYDRSTDPGSAYGPPLGNSIGTYLYSLGTVGYKANRFGLSIKTTNDKFKQLSAAIQPLNFRPGFDSARWLTNYSSGFPSPLTLTTPFFLYRGLIVLGFNTDNTPIIGSTVGDGAPVPLPGTLFHGRWTPTRPDSTDYPHDPISNPYMNYRRWTGPAYHAEGQVEVTFYPN
jgi:hypothetical protein